MTDQILFELLPIEVTATQHKQLFIAQLKKGISLSQIIPTIEKEFIAKVTKAVARLAKEKDPAKIEVEYVRASRMIHEIFKWLEYLVAARKQMQSIEVLPEPEKEAVHRIELKMHVLMATLEPMKGIVLKKRQAENKDLASILLKTIEQMEKETLNRAKKIILKYKKQGKEKYASIHKTFGQFFQKLKSHSEKIIPFLQAKVPEWNALVLKEGRGFYLHKPAGLPCSILFSVSGNYSLIFESVGHLLGVGTDKLVFRSISLPHGKIQALIKPLYTKEVAEAPSEELRKNLKDYQFHNMWLETEVLVKLRNKRGIVDLKERMVIPIEGENTLFLIEDYYWDGSLVDYLKFTINNKVEAAKLSKRNQHKILTDLLIGLQEIYKNGILHHDIKPDNILLDLKRRGSKAVIADFHLAAYLTQNERIRELRFHPIWTPPEYAKAYHLKGCTEDEIKTGKLDVWCLGLVFYCLIANEFPFWIAQDEKKDEPVEEMAERVYQQLAGIRKGWLPDVLKASVYYPLLEKMLEPDPDERCTAAEALQILKAIHS